MNAPSADPCRVVFMGSPDFAVPSLCALVDSARYRPVLVATQPPRPRGRGRRPAATPVERAARRAGVAVVHMDRARYAEAAREVLAVRPHVIVVVAFGVILRDDLLEAPPLGCVNVHASLLPRHRGVSPIQAAILAGDAETGCTTMRMDAGVDTGPVLLRRAVALTGRETAGELFERLAPLGAALLVETLDGLVAGTITPRPQGDSPTPVTRRIRKRDGLIDFDRPADVVDRRIRAMTPWPGAFTFCEGRRLIVTRARPVEGPAGEPGVVTCVDPLRVACAGGAIEIGAVKPEGGREMTPREYGCGHRLDVGMRLGPDGVDPATAPG